MVISLKEAAEAFQKKHSVKRAEEDEENQRIKVYLNYSRELDRLPHTYLGFRVVVVDRGKINSEGIM